ncbi:LacI family DNA-binding transcriptional regulator [Kordiimonas sp.]|uniref:LacI family DNA-binding transcriptional regulator n=1 Tax=Kordiimonas sp. TaxID=1970157 RepID=UPI003A8DBB7F
MSKATIKDVARVAEVSLKTVSRVINNEPTVKNATRTKVLKAIEELRYQPDMSARNLRGTKSYAIGLVYDNPNPYYVVDVQEGVLRACRELGYSLQIHPCDAKTGDIVEELSDLVRNSRLAGLVIAPPISEDDRITDALYDRGIHFVRIISASRIPTGASPCVYVNDRAAAFAVADHLIKKGHSNIAFLLGEEEHHSSGERFEGFRMALEQNGIKLHTDLVLKGSYSFDSGFRRATSLLTGSKKPSAIFGCNDEIAAGALAAAKSLGLNVPGDVAIAGFENSPFSQHAQPPLTTAAQSIADIARQAMMLLIADLRPQAVSENNRERKNEFIPELIVRTSTDAEAR